MANTFSNTVILDSPNRVVVIETMIGDGTAIADRVVVDKSALTVFPSASQLKIEKIQYCIYGISMLLEWDATTDTTIAVLGGVGGSSGTLDFTDCPIPDNTAVAGRSGDIVLTANSIANPSSYTLVFYCRL